MKRLISIILILVAAILQAMPVWAADTDISGIFDEQLEASGAQELPDALPDETREQLDELDISPADGSGWSFGSLLDSILNMAGDAGSGIAGSFTLLAAFIILSALLERLTESSCTAAMRRTISAVLSAGACLSAATPIAGFITDAASAVETCCGFDTVFIPVYSAITAAAGKTATAAEYSVLMMTVLEGTALLTDKAALPLLRVILAISLTSSLSPSLRLTGAVKLFEKYLKWILGFLAILVAAVMGVSTVSAGAIDDITAKTARFVISSTVPVVGGAMSDALASVKGCISLLRTSVGSFGMIAMAFILLPPLIKGALWMLCMNVCSVLAEMLDVRCIKGIAESAGSVLSVMNAILIFTGTLTIFTLAVMLGKGA